MTGDELDQPLITEPQRNARCFHTTACQYVTRRDDSELTDADSQLIRRLEIPECRYCLANRFGGVTDPRENVEQSNPAAALRAADPDTIGGD
jgi:hypothetical protein